MIPQNKHKKVAEVKIKNTNVPFRYKFICRTTRENENATEMSLMIDTID